MADSASSYHLDEYQKVLNFAIQSGFEPLTDGQGLNIEVRKKLGAANIAEEYRELRDAQNDLDWIDAMADLIYVVFFAHVMWGIEPLIELPNNPDHYESATRWMTSPTAIFEGDPTPADLAYRLAQIYQWIYHIESTSRTKSSPPSLINLAFNLVHTSNMSKFTESYEVAIATVDKYAQDFANQQSIYDSPKTKLNNGLWVIYNESSGKILKAKTYQTAQELFYANPIVSEWLSHPK